MPVPDAVPALPGSTVRGAVSLFRVPDGTFFRTVYYYEQ